MKIFPKAASIGVIILPLFLQAQTKDKCIFSNKDSLEKNIGISVIPNINAGTHINGVGIDLMLKKLLPLTNTSGLEMSSRSGIKYYLTYLGIPGSSFTAEEEIELAYGFGKKLNISAYQYPEMRSNTISYYYIGYYSTDKTSQFSGGVKYRHITPKWEFNYVFEDDYLAFEELDQYRTSAFEANYKKIKWRKVYGIGTGLIFWTGTTKGLGFLNRHQSYNLIHQYGGDYSNGIAYLKFYYNSVSFSVGYDSEGIRTFVQNNFHYLIDDGMIPALKRGNRIYIQLSFLDFGSLY